MKKFVIMFGLIAAAVLFMAPQGTHAQDWETLWVLPSYPTPAYPWMSGTLAFTGLAYNPKYNLVHVVSPKTNQGNLDIHVFNLDPATGDTVGEVWVDKNIINSGFSFGRFGLFKIQCTKQGEIFACNLVTPLWGICYPGPPPNCQPELLNQGPFKIFKWATPTSNPILVYQTPALASDTAFFGGTMTYTRWGDGFGLIGGYDSLQIFVSGGDPSGRAMNSEFDVFQSEDSTTNKLGLVRKIQSSLNGIASHGLAPTGKPKTKPVWCDSNTRVASKQSQDNPPISIRDIPISMTHTSGTIRYFETQEYGRSFVIVADGKNENGGDSTSARIIDVSNDNDYFNLGSPTPPINNRALQNSSGFKNWVGDVDYKIDNFQITLFVLMSGNGIAAYRSTFTIPVELASLRANLAGDAVDLRWFITQERNNQGFDVQRSYGGETWETIAFIPGRGTTRQEKEYSYSDPLRDMTITAGEVQYRLKQIDFDGRFNYSPIVRVLLTGAPATVALGQNYPNPFNPSTTVSYQIDGPGFVSIKIYDAMGREVRDVLGAEQTAGTHSVTIQSDGLPAGVYYYRLNALGRTLQKKMVVLQ